MSTKAFKQQLFLEAINAKYGKIATITRTQIKELMSANDNLSWPYFMTSERALKSARGEFTIPWDNSNGTTNTPIVPDPAVASV